MKILQNIVIERAESGLLGNSPMVTVKNTLLHIIIM